MPQASVKRLIECKKKDLINLVLDIEKYPEFVPFCFDAKIYENKNEGDLKIIIAAHPKSDEEGPLDYLGNRLAIIDKTEELIKGSEFVVSGSSTALAFAIIYKKS